MNTALKIALRKASKKPVYTLITFSGLVIGIASCLLIYLWIRNEMAYEKFHPGYSRIFRVLTLGRMGGEIVKSAGCYRPLAASLKQTYPQIEFATYLSYDSEDSPFTTLEGNEKIEARCATTNGDFFSVFGGFTFLEGSPERAFSQPSDIVLSETVARKLFGNKPALNKIIKSDKYTETTYTVSGVVRIPERSHIDFGCLIPEQNRRGISLAGNWSDKGHVRVYIRLAENAVINPEFLEQITNHLRKVSVIPEKLLFQPIADIHLYSDYSEELYDRNISSFRYILIFSGLALLILVMSAINFSILSAARSSERSAEIGMRKVCGATRPGIIRQFMSEAIAETSAATIAAIIIVVVFLPLFNQFTGLNLDLSLSAGLIAGLLGLTVFAGIIAGIYPSLYLSSFKPVTIFLKGKHTASGRNFTPVLVVMQFMISTFFIIAVTVLIRQLNYIQGKDLGFDRQNVVVIPTGLWYENKPFKEALLSNPDVLGVTATAYAPLDFNWTTILPVRHGDRIDSVRMSMMWVDAGFIKTYRLRMIRGRFLNMDFDDFWEVLKADSAKQRELGNRIVLPVVINETAAKVLGYTDPLGERIGDYVIEGVVKDFNFRSLRHSITPLIMVYDPQNLMTINIRIAGVRKAETLKFIHDTYQKYRDKRNFSYAFFDDLLMEKYGEEIRLRNMTLLFSLLAIVISVMGILGMAVFSCDRRRREIGIRKVNGAGVPQIMILLNRDFMRWVVIAFLLAAPVSWYVMKHWLMNFAYRTELSVWIFVLAGILSSAIALITVNWKIYRAARKNPVETLRSE